MDGHDADMAVVFNVFIWTYGLILLGRGRSDIKLKPRSIILNYGTVPTLIGAVLFFTGAGSYIPKGVLNGFSYLGGLCTPVSLFVTGSLIAAIPLKKLFSNLNTYYVCFIKLLVIPFAVYFILRFGFRAENEFALFGAIVSGLPTAANAPMFAELYSIVPDFAAQTVGIMTVLSTFTVPVVVWLLGLVQ